jgi:hypothetical protein
LHVSVQGVGNPQPLEPCIPVENGLCLNPPEVNVACTLVWLEQHGL